MIYLIIGLFFVLLSFIEAVELSEKSSQGMACLVGFIMILFAGLRHEVGTDWNAYEWFYNDKTNGVEVGYAFINNTFSDLKINYNIFLLFINGVSITLVYFGLKKNSKLLVISFLIFFSDLYLYFNLSGIRQAVAISITLYSVTYALERKFLKFLFCIIIAACFHVTSAIFLIAYFIPRYNFRLKHYLIMIGALALISTGVYSLVNIFSTGVLAYKIKFYLELQEQVENIQSLFVIGIMKRLIIIFMVLFFGRKLLKEERTIFFFNLYLVGTGLYVSTFLISPDIGVRLASYFLIFDVVLAGNLVFVNTDFPRRLLILFLLSSMAMYKISTYTQQKPYIYKSIFSK
jgi:hypothetical protein